MEQTDERGQSMEEELDWWLAHLEAKGEEFDDRLAASSEAGEELLEKVATGFHDEFAQAVNSIQLDLYVWNENLRSSVSLIFSIYVLKFVEVNCLYEHGSPYFRAFVRLNSVDMLAFFVLEPHEGDGRSG